MLTLQELESIRKRYYESKDEMSEILKFNAPMIISYNHIPVLLHEVDKLNKEIVDLNRTIHNTTLRLSEWRNRANTLEEQVKCLKDEVYGYKVNRINKQPAVESKLEWINIVFPKRDEWVLVNIKRLSTDDYITPCVAKFKDGCWWNINLVDVEEFFDAKVTHWMPLPKCPEGEKNE